MRFANWYPYLILFLGLFSSGLKAGESRPILEYQYGNQIVGSYLTILEDGTVQHEERSCCPPQTNNIIENRLSNADRETLLQGIAESSSGEQIETEGQPSAPGGMAGSLIVFDAQGTAINIRTITRSDELFGNDTIKQNQAIQAMWILDFVKSFVLQKIY